MACSPLPARNFFVCAAFPSSSSSCCHVMRVGACIWTTLLPSSTHVQGCSSLSVLMPHHLRVQAAVAAQVIERRASNASAGPRSSRAEGRRSSRDRAKKEASPKQAEVRLASPGSTPGLCCCCLWQRAHVHSWFGSFVKALTCPSSSSPNRLRRYWVGLLSLSLGLGAGHRPARLCRQSLVRFASSCRGVGA